MSASTERSATRGGAIMRAFLWIAARLPGFGVGMAGLAKFYAAARWDRLFLSWGYPAWLSPIVGVVEVAGAILLFVPRTTLYGAVILAVTMLGAFLTLVTHRGGQLGWGMAPLTYFIWLSVLALVIRTRGTSARRE